ncbi:hypothetical protein F4693_000170 [Sphingomonas endophytica]|uniref:DUF4376 domain-containing protein n=1 Tax=Sphingomonas endophytica TaxID=869719 RepID=A0A7X0MLL9_9SPHN|nr:DUF4376 domain-containing protein [Sphingomonas endophytica]MBB6503221.1 hypothetical protein [Sphingomonas endophytica]
MRYAVADDTTGLVHSIVEATTLESLLLNVPEGSTPHPASDTVEPGTWRWDGSALIAIAPTIEALRSACWEAVKARRQAAEDGGCASPLGAVDTDQESRLKVSGAVQMAMIAQAANQPFTVDWTMHDDSVVKHDAAAMIAMGLAVGRHIAACHAVALAKRAAIDAAVNAADIAAVEVDHGWPA